MVSIGTHPPRVAEREVEGQIDKGCATDERLARLCADSCADLVYERNVLVPWALRYKVSTDAIHGSEFV